MSAITTVPIAIENVAATSAAATASKEGKQPREYMPNPPCGRDEGSWCRVLANNELQSDDSPRSTRHIEIELEEGSTYKTVSCLFVLLL